MDSPKWAAGCSSKNQRWATPRALVAAIEERELVTFRLDLAAERRSAVAPIYFGPDQRNELDRDAFAVAPFPWGEIGAAWLNPPYGRGVGRWLELAARWAEEGWPTYCLVLARTDTRWWHRQVMGQASRVTLIQGRIRFCDPDTLAPAPASCPAPSALIYYAPGAGRRRWTDFRTWAPSAIERGAPAKKEQ